MDNRLVAYGLVPSRARASDLIQRGFVLINGAVAAICSWTPADTGKGGIVRDQAARRLAVDNVTEWLTQRPQWNVLGVCPSPIVGGSGNLEFLIGAVKNG